VSRVLVDPAAVADAAAEFVYEAARDAIAARGEFRIAFPGGRTPRALLQRLTREPYHEAIDWTRVQVLQVDERAVPPDHADSNYRLLREALLDPLGPEGPLARRMRAESPDLSQAARDYADELRRPLDLVVLGLGEDGHIASLFPGSPLLLESEALVAVVEDSPKPPARRLTLSPRALREARRALVLVTGADKRAAVRAALGSSSEVSQVPARVVPGAQWMLDSAAAG